MQMQTRGIVLKQTKILNDKRMLTVFSERYGKISVVTTGETGRSKVKSSLAYKPFTLGNYYIYKSKDLFRMGKGETLKSYYKLGEDIDKYLEGSYALEFTDKILIENEPAPRLFSLLAEYFEILERRSREYSFLTLAYQIKALMICGYMPILNQCAVCGKKKPDFMFNVEAGGTICSECAKDNGLIYKSDSDIIKKIAFIAQNPIRVLETIYLEKEPLDAIKTLIRSFTKYHLGISDLKSEKLIDK